MDYSISPDDHLLAFWIRVPPYLHEDARLAILNLENGEIINYCLSGINSGGNPSIDTYPIPIWAPDGTHLAIKTRNPQMPENSLITLLDINQNTAVQVKNTDNLDPVGWLSLP